MAAQKLHSFTETTLPAKRETPLNWKPLGDVIIEEIRWTGAPLDELSLVSIYEGRVSLTVGGGGIPVTMFSKAHGAPLSATIGGTITRPLSHLVVLTFLLLNQSKNDEPADLELWGTYV